MKKPSAAETAVCCRNWQPQDCIMIRKTKASAAAGAFLVNQWKIVGKAVGKKSKKQCHSAFRNPAPCGRRPAWTGGRRKRLIRMCTSVAGSRPAPCFTRISLSNFEHGIHRWKELSVCVDTHDGLSRGFQQIQNVVWLLWYIFDQNHYGRERWFAYVDWKRWLEI